MHDSKLTATSPRGCWGTQFVFGRVAHAKIGGGAKNISFFSEVSFKELKFFNILGQVNFFFF